MRDVRAFHDFTRFLSSLSFGGALGGGLSGLIYTLLGTAISGATFGQFLIAGVFLGSAFHVSASKAWQHFLGPIADYGTARIQLRKLRYYRDAGVIDNERYGKLASRIVEQDVLTGDDDPGALVTGRDLSVVRVRRLNRPEE